MQETFHQYCLTRELAKKHSHSTYLASLPKEPERQVVVIVFNSSLFSSSHEREDLLQKAKRIKELQYQYFMPILDIGTEAEQPFIVYEYLPNGSLRSRLKEISPARPELRESLTIVSQVGEALAYAHEHNIIHGNLRPENILFDANGQPILTDFYLLSRKDTILRDQATEEYAFCYLAPEQFAGTCDARSDQYALGCLTYELITGKIPFAEQGFRSIMKRPRDARPAPLSESVADLPPSFETAVFKTLAKDPNERFFDFSLFLDIIRSALSPLPAFLPSRPTHFHKQKAISHPISLEGSEDIASSMRHSAAPSSPASPTRELFPILKITEDAMPEMVADPVIAEGTMPEQASTVSITEPQEAALPLPRPEDADPIGKRKNGNPNQPLQSQVNNVFAATKLEGIPQLEFSPSKQGMSTDNTETFWLTDSFVEQEMNEPPVEAPAGSVHEQSKDATAKIFSLQMTASLMGRSITQMTSTWQMPLPPTSSSVVRRPSTGLTQHGRTKRLGLALLAFIILTTLGTYAASLPMSRVSQPVRVSRADISAHPTQVARSPIVSVIETLPTPTLTPTPTPTVPPTVPVRIIPTPTPIPFVSVSLSSYVNNEGIGSAPGQANLDGSGYSFPANQLPLAGQRTFNDMPYQFSGSTPGTNDNVVALGQTINFPQGNYQQAFLLVTSTWGSAGGTATVNYTDGTTSSVSLSAPDWLAGPSGVLSTSYRYSSKDIDQSVSYIYGTQLGIDGTKIASSLTLPSTAQPSPHQSSLHVFALTLQHA